VRFGNLLVFAFFIFALARSESLASARPLSTSISPFDHLHTQFDQVLTRFIALNGSESRINYKRLKQERSRLDAYLKTLSEVRSDDFEKFSKEQKMAFLINAYNGFTLEMISSQYPISSVKEIKGGYDKRFISLFDEIKSLNDIERQLRQTFREPKTFFALSSGVQGAPALLGNSYNDRDLYTQLERATRLFLGDPKRNFYDRVQNRLKVSRLFNWFEDDFRRSSGSVPDFVAPYLASDRATQDKIRALKSFESLDYSWKLNELF